MLASNRVIRNTGGTLTDLSTRLNNYFSETVVTNLDADDYLYIGSDVPFNHRYFHMAVVNDVACSVTVEIWDGNEWVEVVDVQDFTKTAGGTKSLARSGIIAWVLDKNKTWVKETTTENMASSGLQTLKIYNLYWARLSWSADLTALTEMKYIGHKFSKDEDLGGYYPDLVRSNALAGFATGKTSWDEQHIMAAEEIFKALRAKREVWAKSQIFTWEAYTVAACHKVAEIVYSAFGTEYETRKDDAAARFEAELDATLSTGIDKDEDGHIDEEELAGVCVGLVRR